MTTGDESSPAPAENSGGSSPSSAELPMKFEWGPPVSSPPPEPSPPADGDNDTGPSTLEGDDVGNAPASGSSPSENQEQSDEPTEAGSQADPSEASPPEIPRDPPDTTKGINAVLRGVATWLGRALAVLGPLFELDPRVRLILAVLETTLWLIDYLPKIYSYLDQPKTLEELQNAAANPQPGYETHHIVEAQKRSDDPQSNAQRFPDRIDSRENLVQVPYWKHVEISSWYSRRNDAYGGISPRAYLRRKSWDEQYRIGLQKLRDFGILK
jgi:hypothetical protein